MLNILLESAACGRTIITTNRSGCREIGDDRVTEYLVEKKNSDDLISKILIFIQRDIKDKEKMELGGREEVEKEFDRGIVVREYLNEIKMIVGA